MADPDSAFQEPEPKKNETATDKFAEFAFGGALEFVRNVQRALAQYDGNIPDEEKAALRARWKKMGPLDTILVQQKLGSQLNAAIN